MRQADVPEAALALEGVDQHRHRVVVLGQVRRVDLARVAGEHDLGALADAGEDRLQRGGLEVLGLVDQHVGAEQRAAAEVGDGLHRELLALGELVEHGAGVGVAAPLGEGDERVVHRGHPRVELLVERAGQEPELGLPDRARPAGTRRPCRRGSTPSPARARRPARGSSCRCRPCRRGRRRAPRGRAGGRGRTAAPSTAGRSPHGSGTRSSGSSSPSTWRTSADWLPARSTA